jgi:ferredoxin
VSPDAGGARAPRCGPNGDEKAGEPGVSRWSLELVLDPVACDGRGVCAETFPERIELDRWGYPVIDGEAIAPALFEHAERAVRSCPKQALHLVERKC